MPEGRARNDSTAAPAQESDRAVDPRLDPESDLVTDCGLRGKLLIAMPHMDDDYFRESVILITEHSTEGAMGFVLTTPSADVSFADLLMPMDSLKPLGRAQLSARIAELDGQNLLRCGGPCNEHHGFILHRLPVPGRDDKPPYEGCEVIDRRYAFTVSNDVLEDIACGAGPDPFLVALGYAGWGPGQLDEELRENVWLHAEATDQLLFRQPPDELWQSCFLHLGIDPGQLSTVAGRA